MSDNEPIHPFSSFLQGWNTAGEQQRQAMLDHANTLLEQSRQELTRQGIHIQEQQQQALDDQRRSEQQQQANERTFSEAGAQSEYDRLDGPHKQHVMDIARHAMKSDPSLNEPRAIAGAMRFIYGNSIQVPDNHRSIDPLPPAAANPAGAGAGSAPDVRGAQTGNTPNAKSGEPTGDNGRSMPDLLAPLSLEPAKAGNSVVMGPPVPDRNAAGQAALQDFTRMATGGMPPIAMPGVMSPEEAAAAAQAAQERLRSMDPAQRQAILEQSVRDPRTALLDAQTVHQGNLAEFANWQKQNLAQHQKDFSTFHSKLQNATDAYDNAINEYLRLKYHGATEESARWMTTPHFQTVNTAKIELKTRLDQATRIQKDLYSQLTDLQAVMSGPRPDAAVDGRGAAIWDMYHQSNPAGTLLGAIRADDIRKQLQQLTPEIAGAKKAISSMSDVLAKRTTILNQDGTTDHSATGRMRRAAVAALGASQQSGPAGRRGQQDNPSFDREAIRGRSTAELFQRLSEIGKQLS